MSKYSDTKETRTERKSMHWIFPFIWNSGTGKSNLYDKSQNVVGG